MNNKAPMLVLDCPDCWPVETYWTRHTGACTCDVCGAELSHRLQTNPATQEAEGNPEMLWAKSEAVENSMIFDSVDGQPVKSCGM